MPDKKKSKVNVRDLKPSKDAKGGGRYAAAGGERASSPGARPTKTPGRAI